MKNKKEMGMEQKKRIWWDKWANKKEKKRRKERRRGKIRKRNTEKEREKKKNKKRVFCLPLRSTEIGLSVFVGVRGKVGPRNEGYAWVQKSGSFIKLQEVGIFLLGLFLA